MDVAVRKSESLPNYLPLDADIKLLRDGFFKLPVDREFLEPRLRIIQIGMGRITGDPILAEEFPLREYARDAYGEKYVQEVGLCYRRDERKWWFQFISDAYPRTFEGQRDAVAREDFFAALRDLDEKAMDIALAVAELFDARKHRKEVLHKYPGSMVDRVRRGRCITRALRYLPNVKGTIESDPHIDRSLFTVHWRATHEGLRIRMPFERWVSVQETETDTVAVFPGRKFGAVSRGVLGYGTPHGVRAKHRGPESRYSFVSFVHPAAHAEDAEWLLEHDSEIKEFERSLQF